jgi:hypothetical protein
MAYTPPKATNPELGLFQNITKLTGSSDAIGGVTSLLSGGTPEIAAAQAAIATVAEMLPPGEVKDWLSKTPTQMIKDLIGVIKGRKYTEGDYRLAERLNDQILGYPDISQPQATDAMVDVAHWVFNQLFGVRIATEDDLNALQTGFDAYKAREQSKGISDNAIRRAVFLKQNYYPNSTYNVAPWDLKWFSYYPLVDRIPGYEPGTWYTGKVIGGGNAVNGIIQLDADSVLRQVSNAQYSATGGWLNQGIGGISSATLQKYAPFIAILIVLGVILSVKFKLYRP